MTTTASPIDPSPLGYPLPTDVPPDLPPGRHCSRGNIIRHYVPDPDDVDLGSEEGVFHTMVTVWSRNVIGQLIRWVWNNGEFGYEVRIDGMDETGGLAEAACQTIETCAGLARVANELRYEWEIITGVYGPDQWTVLGNQPA